MMMEKFLTDVINEVSMRLPCGGVFLDWRNEDHLTILEETLQKKGMSLFHIDEVISNLIEKESNQNNLSNNDISTLKLLGLNLNSRNDYKNLDIENIDSKSTKFITGGGVRVFEDKLISFDKLYSYIKTQKQINITSATINRMKSADNIQICQWMSSKGPGYTNYEQIITIFKLYKQFPRIIKITKSLPQGINYEMQRVDELNDILSKSETPQSIYIYKDDKVIPMATNIKQAIKITETGKSDIALENEKKQELFWISYKHGDYFGKQGQVLMSVPFQQYGCLQALYDIGLNREHFTDSKDIKGEDIQLFFNTFIDGVMKLSGMNKYSIFNVVSVDVKKKDIQLRTESGKVVEVTPSNPAYELMSDPSILRKLTKNVIKTPGLNVHFFLQGTPGYYFDMTAGTELISEESLNTIAGKSIYGVDFYMGNNKFGRENVNMLLQASQKFIVQQHFTGAESDGVILKTDDQGHILINPNLPTSITDELQEIIDIYVPIIFCRFTRNEHFKWVDDKGKNMIFGGRFLILPKGKKPSASVEVKL